MPDRQEFATQVVIVGAGVVGSALALGLAAAGWRVCLVDRTLPERRVGTSGFDPRTLAIAPSARAWLSSFIRWPEECCDFGRMVVWDDQSTGSVEFDAATLEITGTESTSGGPVTDTAPAPLGTIIEQSLLVGALWDAVQQEPNIAVLAPYELERLSYAANAHVDLRAPDGGAGLRVSAPLIVGADGGGSRVRALSGAALRRMETGHRAIASVVTLAQPHCDTAWQAFLPSGPLALLPLATPVCGQGDDPDEHSYASLVWSATAERVEQLAAQGEQEFCSSVTHATQGRLGQIIGCDARASFPIVQQQSEQYVPNAHTVLLGDAAHVLHPMAGQGVNLGLRHAALLLAELARLPKNAAVMLATRHELLQRYERQARGRADAMILGMSVLQEVFERQGLTFRWLRSVGMQATDGASWLKRQLARSATGIGY